MRKGEIISYLLSIMILLFFSSWCEAGSNETFGVGAKASGVGQAYTAYADDFSAIHYNPGGLTQMKGFNVSVGLQVIDIDQEQEHKRGKDYNGEYGDDPLWGRESDNKSGNLYLPNIGFVYSPEGSRWSFGYAAYAPFAVHEYQDVHHSVMRYNGTDVYNTHVNYASPTVAYKILDNLSIGVSVGMGIQEEGGHIKVRLPGIESHPVIAPLGLPAGTGYQTSLGDLDFDYDDPVVYSANVGVLWKPADWLAFGLTYRSESHAEMDGRTHFRYSQDYRNLVQALGMDDPGSGESFEGNCTQMQPQSVTVGTKVDITDRWRVMVDFQWTDWSVRNYEHWTYDGNPQILQVASILAAANGENLPTDRIIQKRGWKDTKEFRFGTEYDALDWLSLRFGYSYRPCVVKEKYWENNWPLTDFHIFSLGSGIKVCERGTLDLAYQFMYGDNWDIENNESALSNQDRVRDTIMYAPYYGSDIEESYRIHRVVVTFNYRF